MECRLEPFSIFQLSEMSVDCLGDDVYYGLMWFLKWYIECYVENVVMDDTMLNMFTIINIHYPYVVMILCYFFDMMME